MKLLKVLVLGVVAALLTGCVSPSHSVRDGQWPYVDSRAYARAPAYYGSGWYPWRSVDYFYLGGYDCGFGYGGSWSFGHLSRYPYCDPYFSPGFYSAWYAPYGFYDPWYHHYDPWFRGYYGWTPGFRHHDPNRRDHRGVPDDPVMAPGPPKRYDRRPGRFLEDERPVPSEQTSEGRPPVVRNISIAPSRNSADQGMVIVNRADRKAGQIRVPPVQGNDGPGAEIRPKDQPRYPANSARSYPRSPAVPSGFSNPGVTAGPAVRYSPPAVSPGRQSRKERKNR